MQYQIMKAGTLQISQIFQDLEELMKFINFLIDVESNSMKVKTIQLVKINANNSLFPIIFIECGIHAREWISPAAALFIIDKLTKCMEKVILYFQYKSYFSAVNYIINYTTGCPKKSGNLGIKVS